MNQGMNPYQAPTAQSLSQQEERDWKWLLFSFDGRASRGDYWKGVLYSMGAVVVMGIVVAVVLGTLGKDGSGSDSPTPLALMVIGLFGLVIGIPFLWASLAISVKRWHDRNKSALWLLIGLIPYIGSIWSFIECGCLRGTTGQNSYGPDPLA